MSNQSNEVVVDCARTFAIDHNLTAAQAPQLAAAFKALGDPVRLRLVAMIAANAGDAVCVCDLSEPFELSASTMSHHLKVLREAGLVSHERRGTWVYYRLNDETFTSLSQVLLLRQAVQ
ncbi:ArsR/SmtB family transcription factor [Natronoglycomyces albus]|uniref:Winged helix-turn-helix transcriptional regulator n=1 Tax=Natronoglycomyces albus TaxID=2811108 RepID=A0A895XTC7_9ACTN|nr:metalloregulator ArsR/SmtB family transcription factor [Natronoglycomyces albus]QSB06743.1 winged helix-turn-helix transcriptional regulator [Natronoglycomyces albus]